MTEHTSGPWEVERSQGCFLVVSRNEPKDWPILVAQTGSAVEIDEANARLIAAAPDLLNALDSLLCRIAVNGDDVGIISDAYTIRAIQKAFAAVAKATAEE